ncbi:hypothetical protein GCM10009527_033060 [Actinomadura nitritigenes]|uniref:Uncharacterized protein n=1 Tax=Actinomadura nitritigenes TaxID=134602 RepID=A0ABS3RDH2_9ACTN|nr:hypothetical protein [Actinomadura nitritigenes]MBO2444282.1 hypothetical protein [Actinomadura nitritigenes]
MDGVVVGFDDGFFAGEDFGAGSAKGRPNAMADTAANAGEAGHEDASKTPAATSPIARIAFSPGGMGGCSANDCRGILTTLASRL